MGYNLVMKIDGQVTGVKWFLTRRKAERAKRRVEAAWANVRGALRPGWDEDEMPETVALVVKA